MTATVSWKHPQPQQQQQQQRPPNHCRDDSCAPDQGKMMLLLPCTITTRTMLYHPWCHHPNYNSNNHNHRTTRNKHIGSKIGCCAIGCMRIHKMRSPCGANHPPPPRHPHPPWPRRHPCPKQCRPISCPPMRLSLPTLVVRVSLVPPLTGKPSSRWYKKHCCCIPKRR